PDRIDAIDGSVIRVEVSGEPRPFTIRFGATPLSAKNRGDASIAEVTARQSGYLAFEFTVQGGVRLIPVSVTPDRAPTIRIENPGKDLLMPDVNAIVPFMVPASDDFGLRSLDLRYTKVAGSGEQFEFTEGSLPLDVIKEDERSWKGRGAIA